MGLQPETEICEAVCHHALWKYGVALWRVNTGGVSKRRASWTARLRDWFVGRNEKDKKQAPLIRLGGEIGGRGELV